jgi:hypothetical protein
MDFSLFRGIGCFQPCLTAVTWRARITSRSGELSQVKFHYVFQQYLHLLLVLELLLVDDSLAL